MASGTLVSRVLGLLRQTMTIGVVGAVGLAADAWNAANTLPNNFHLLLAGGRGPAEGPGADPHGADLDAAAPEHPPHRCTCGARTAARPAAASWTRPRYDVRPPPRATDLEMIELDVYGAQCTILEPASWC